jgi:hypothetical protein
MIDHFDCEADVEPEGSVWTKTHFIGDLTGEQIANVKNRAAYYADMKGTRDARHCKAIVESAVRVLRALAALEDLQRNPSA